MKLAIIVPPGYKNILTSVPTGYQMALGQHLVGDGKYNLMYRERRLEGKGDFLIVDNGAAEGERESFDSIFYAAMEVGADEVVMPDELRDINQTLEMSLDPAALSLVPKRMRLMVPQGKNWRQWESCLLEMVNKGSPATIGVAKHLEALNGGRAYALERIKAYEIHYKCNVHLLGVYEKPFLEAYRAWKVLPTVRGIDTGAPIAYAQNNYFIDDNNHFSLDWNPQKLRMGESSVRSNRMFTNANMYATSVGALGIVATEYDPKDGTIKVSRAVGLA